MGKSARHQTSAFLGLADDAFVRRDDFVYGNSGIVEHRVTFTARPPPEKLPSSRKSY